MSSLQSMLKTLLTPRMILIVWGGIGALVTVYVMIAAAVQRPDRPGAAIAAAKSTGPVQDPRLLKGEVADFAYAFTPRNAPTVVFNDDKGGSPTRLADFKGDVLVVNFWATWCAPCKVEIPSLDKLASQLADDGVKVLLVAADQTGRKAAEKTLGDLGVAHATPLMDKSFALVSAMGGPSALPITVIYDRDGGEVGRLIGEADWSSPEAIALVQRIAASS